MISEVQCGLSREAQEQINAIFKTYPSIEKVVLYGSRAKGNFKPGSDIDLTIIAKGFELMDLFQVQDKLDDLLLPYKIDLSIFDKLHHPSLIDHIQRVGKEFYKKASAPGQ